MRILDGDTVKRLLPLRDCIDALDDAFRAGGQGAVKSFVGGVAAAGGKFHMKSALGGGSRPLFAAKINANFPGNPARGAPTVQGLLVLFDGAVGDPLAIIDSGSLTAIRTAAASGVAARHLASPNAETLAVVGCGVQGLPHVQAMRAVRPIARVVAYDQVTERARNLCEAAGALGVEASVAADLADATHAAEIVVTSTSSRTAFLKRAHLRGGAFVAAVGVDSPDKAEITPELYAAAFVIADDVDQCAAMGDLRAAMAAGVERGHVRGTLADVAASPARFRAAPDQVTIFDSTGIPLEDLVAAAILFERAERENAGVDVALQG